jgi:ABC-2 type transport system permease protein
MEDKKTKNIKRENLLWFGSILGLIIGLNIIFSFFFTRLDLTSEKRYTLSNSTKTMLKKLEDIIYIKVYLSGTKLPPDYAELSQKTRELLDEMRIYSDNIEYEFIDPAQGKDPKEMTAIYGELYRKGLRPQAIQSMGADGVTTNFIVPGALVSYRQRETPLQLVDSDDGLIPAENVVKYSIEKLEYNISNTIRRQTHQQMASVAFLKGHGELANVQVLKAAVAIAQFYAVDSVILDNSIHSIFNVEITDTITRDYKIKNNKYDLLIIAKPTLPFGNYEKYLLDQFVMRGGRLLWYVDPVFAEMDSLQYYSEMPVLSRDLNLEDMFFRYGVRLNTNLLQDLDALRIPVAGGQIGGQTQYKHIPWYYFPIITPYLEHPIVKNLNLLKTEFISSIDTVGSRANLQKTVLLTTSNHTKVVNAPAIVSLETLKRRANMAEYAKEHVPVSVLVEGEFNSLFDDNLEGEKLSELAPITKSKPTKMVFVADGDMIKNQLGMDNMGNIFPYPLGADRYSGMAFGNKNFLLNAVNYLCDDEDILQVRSKDFKMRLLDSNRILKKKTQWQTVNLVLPLVVIGVLGLALLSVRKMKYGAVKM